MGPREQGAGPWEPMRETETAGREGGSEPQAHCEARHGGSKEVCERSMHGTGGQGLTCGNKK